MKSRQNISSSSAMATCAPLLLFLLTATVCGALQRQSLGGLWSVTGSELSVSEVRVPGGIFSNLMDRDVIDNIFFGFGDANSSWVGESDWTYSSTFTVEEALLAHRTVLLVFEGVDTFATISINGNEVGATENMFVRYTFNIKDQLHTGDNEISVKFASAVTRAAELASDPSNEYIVPPECPTPEAQGICHANRVRKMQASFSWDWGPAFASCGIWKPVYLEAFDNAVIDYVVATPIKGVALDSWTIFITTYFDGGEVGTISGTLNTVLQLGDVLLTESTPIEMSMNEHFEILVTTTIDIASNQIELWWPNGYGEQPLYNLNVSFVGETEQDEKTVRVGFRTIEVVQDSIDTGLSFYFKVNDVPIFAKGANEIPISILPEAGQDEITVRRVLQSAKDAHMNMLRVWGGGVYESDYFYDLTDEFGLLIWQDFMFACAMYPTDEAFLTNVGEEISHQLKRVGGHPSIAIWAGNNENEAALVQNWYGTAANFSIYAEDYITLYVDTIQSEILRVLPNAIFATSSPSNGLQSDAEGHLAQNPQDQLYGDVHFYDYKTDSWNALTFPTPRFASEFGYQSMPCTEAWNTATTSLDNLRPDSEFLIYRQHHPNGNNENLDLITQQLQLPDSSHPNYVKAFIYFSQILQAQSIKTEVEHYRSYKGRVNDDGRGNTMGALYWQLNDVWVAPTWSGMDFTGRWKMLHYMALSFYNPLLITGALTATNQLEIFAVFDGLQVPDITVKAVLHIHRWNSLDMLASLEFPVVLDPLASVLVTSMDAETALTTAGCGSTTEARRNCFFHLHLADQDNNLLAPSNYVFAEKPKNSLLANASVSISLVSATNSEMTEFNIVVTTDTVALFVWLDSHQIMGRFSENGFMQVSTTRTVHFTAEQSVPEEELAAILTVTHLRDPAYL